jgi:acylphosphatase
MNQQVEERELIGMRCLVSGRVQGVFFRASAREEAQRLGLGGYARNLADGRVEVLACGPREAVTRLRAWLLQGPPLARVDALDCEPLAYQHYHGFTQR